MTKRINYTFFLIAVFVVLFSCSDDDFNNVEIPNFDYPTTVTFESNLSSYNIYQDSLHDLIPSEDFHLLELSSVLYTDYAYKQRLIKVPAGTSMERINNFEIDFPNETILTKTFFYYNDERDQTLGKRILETRVMIKSNDIWNVATYIWNEEQTDAVLELGGRDISIDWIDENGNPISTLYDVPNEDECIACHQSNSQAVPIGTNLRNLNVEVERGGVAINQLEYLQTEGVLIDNFTASEVEGIVNYKDVSISLAERGRAYLDINCSHCHNPSGWEEAAEENLDFRYEVTLNESGLSEQQNQNRITEMVLDGEMPFIGTTILDEEGVELIVDFIESL